MAKLRYSLNNGTTWTILEGVLPITIPALPNEEVWIESYAYRFGEESIITEGTIMAIAAVDDGPGSVIFDFEPGEDGPIPPIVNPSLLTPIPSLPRFPFSDDFSVGAIGKIEDTVNPAGVTWLRYTRTGDGDAARFIRRSTDGNAWAAEFGATLNIYPYLIIDSPNYWAETDIIPKIARTDYAVGPFVRASLVQGDYYGARYDGVNIRLFKAINNTTTTLGTVHTVTLPLNQVSTLRVTADGDQISASLNGTVVVGPITDTSVAGPGFPVMRIGGGAFTPTEANAIQVGAFRANAIGA